MHKTPTSLVVLALAACAATTAVAQTMPSTQPKLLHIFQEQVKPGRAADHAQWEKGWPAAMERAKSPYNYLALASITGTSEVLYVAPYESHAKYAEGMAWEESQPGLEAEFDRLSRGDAEFVSEVRQLQAAARPDLSHGTFPDLAKMRFWEVTTYRIRPGHQEDFVAAAKAYAASASRSAPEASWRTYEVIAGAPGGTYLVFSSVAGFGEFDKAMSADEATMKGVTAEEGAALAKFAKEALVSSNTNRYRLDPKQSYVDAATKAKDPAFWSPRP